LMILRNGGTGNLDSIGFWDQGAGGARHDISGAYGQPAGDMLADLHVAPSHDALPARPNSSIPASLGLRRMLLFPRKDWGRDYLIRNKLGSQSGADFLATTPYSPEAQAGIATIMEDDSTDWIALKHGPKTDQQKKAILASITYK